MPRRPYFPHPLALCCHYPALKCRSASIVVTSTVRVKKAVTVACPSFTFQSSCSFLNVHKHEKRGISLLQCQSRQLMHCDPLNRIMTVQCEGMGEVGSARYELALLPPCPSIRALSYSNCQRSTHSNIQAWQCKC